MINDNILVLHSNKHHLMIARCNLSFYELMSSENI